ncbi:calcium-binding protein [Iningainema tapete]|uniref:Calcium-binding protein n=1 Tax=Iningainema tapete BLCC-T55 TaxID=2748662 RepID=A0A8J6XPX8_9CYAN|nr:calcium-binding protein [Iningainema tapete]MBD2774262.1 hypothetical protein [Iningainema tapete BLCC-T55]
MANISGDFNDNYLIGTPESDNFFGDQGNDTFDGLGGADNFVFNNVTHIVDVHTVDLYIHEVHVWSSDNYDIINNFAINEDRVYSIVPVTQDIIPQPINSGAQSPNDFSPNSGEIEYIFGTTGSDIINGTSANDIIYGRSGNDIIYGYDAKDILYGGTGDDSLYGGANTDELYGGGGNDYLNGGEGLNNVLYGGAGNDILDGRDISSDTLIGGPGNDTYIVDNNPVFGDLGDPIIEYLNEGTDTVQSSANYRLGANLENLILLGSDDIGGLGNALDNRIEGNAGKNFLIGDDGNDYLLGYGDKDVLVGEAGNDILEGGAGDDILDGGSGSDILTGGAGADTFVFSSPFNGIDSITDFKYEEGDKIQVLARGFGIQQDELNKFTFDSRSNALLFNQIQFASLQPGSNFIPSLNIIIV